MNTLLTTIAHYKNKCSPLSGVIHCLPLCGDGDSVVQSPSCVWLCDPMDCSLPGFPVPHHLPEFAQVHVHWIGDAIQPSHPLWYIYLVVQYINFMLQRTVTSDFLRIDFNFFFKIRFYSFCCHFTSIHLPTILMHKLCFYIMVISILI